MSRIKKVLLAMVAILAIGAVGASASSAATATVGVNGGTTCTSNPFAMNNPGTTVVNHALVGTISCPSIPPFGGTARIRGTDSMSVTLGTGGTGSIVPAGSGVGFEIRSLGIVVCTVVITKNPIPISEVSPGVWQPVPALSIPPDGTMSGAGCPAPPATIDLTLNV